MIKVKNKWRDLSLRSSSRVCTAGETLTVVGRSHTSDRMIIDFYSDDLDLFLGR